MTTTQPNKPNATLFKKILLSLFSKKSMIQAGLNPAAIFISFISAKQFFGLINRRVIEHYKLNLFDIALDPFEVKIGFGEQPTVNIKELDFYYGYNSAANFVGYKFYSPNNIATSLSLVTAVMSEPHLGAQYPTYFKHLIFSIYLFVFVIASKIKIIPDDDLHTRYDWTMKTFWNLYVLVFEKTKTKLNLETFSKVKKLIMNDVRLTFCIFRIAEYMDHYFAPKAEDISAYYERLFMDETKDKTRGPLIQEFMNEKNTRCYDESFTTIDKNIIELLIPGDLSIKYLFGDEQGVTVTRYVLKELYDPAYLEDLMESCITDNQRIPEMIDYLINPELLKHRFFRGIQNYIKYHITQHTNFPIEWEPDAGSSVMGEEFDMNEIPEAIKIETTLLDRLINFYIGHVGGLQIARSDTGYIRLAKPRLLRQLRQLVPFVDTKSDTIDYYTKFFLLYGKNLFYYKYAHDHIRSGKDSFHLPIKGTITFQESNMFIVRMLQENSIVNLLQDINKDTTRLSIKNTDIIGIFKTLLGDQIATLLHHKGQGFVQQVYRPYDQITSSSEGQFSSFIALGIDDHDIELLRDRLYCFDFWIAQDVVRFVSSTPVFADHYDSTVLLSLLGTMRETFLGLLIMLTHLRAIEESHQKSYHSAILIYLYCRDILHLHARSIIAMTDLIESLMTRYHDLLHLWINVDDNNQYLYIGFTSRSTRNQDKIDTLLTTEIPLEDSIRRLGYLKNITYYNKRYFIPQL